MRKTLKISILVIVSLITGFCYGYFVHRNKIFPYTIIRNTIHKRMTTWSIGVYEGTTPFDLTDPMEMDNPAITALDVSDVDASFVADPFMVMKDGEFYMFFEVMNLDSNEGDIGYAVSDDGRDWHYKKIILDEAFHLSYPSVYELNGTYYMVPESAEDLSVRLYKATSFPEKWEYIGNLLSGSPFNDPTVFYQVNRFWMFTSNNQHDVLNLFFSDSLTTGWQPHPMNPLIENNKHIANPAGSVFTYDGRIYRLVQDTYPYYGMQVYAVEITELSSTAYKENTDSAKLIVAMTGKGWNAAGMHQVDLHKVGNKWCAVVDGIKKRK